MPVTKSAKKELRIAERRRMRNKSIRSQCKTNITKSERLIFSGELDSARSAVTSAVSSLDKAAKKGSIHPNNAARRKSRLMKKLNKAAAPLLTEAKPRKTEAAVKPEEPQESQ